jgi:AraC-like DNA-binding protein
MNRSWGVPSRVRGCRSLSCLTVSVALSHSHRIARAIDWIKVNYARQFSIDELAAHVQMSATTLHHHFRQLTAMSPLQYQK